MFRDFHVCGQEPHGVQSASTGPVPWVSNLHPTPSLPDTTRTQPPQRGRLRVQKHQRGEGEGVRGCVGLSVTTPSSLGGSRRGGQRVRYG